MNKLTKWQSEARDWFFDVEEFENVAIVGGRRIGKSTLLAMLATQLGSTGFRVALFGPLVAGEYIKLGLDVNRVHVNPTHGFLMYSNMPPNRRPYDYVFLDEPGLRPYYPNTEHAALWGEPRIVMAGTPYGGGGENAKNKWITKNTPLIFGPVSMLEASELITDEGVKNLYETLSYPAFKSEVLGRW